MAQEVALLTEWRERLKRQAESGLTIEAFCEKEGVSTSMLYRWRRHLQDASSTPTASETMDTTQCSGKKRSGPPRRQRSQVAQAKHAPEFLQVPVRGMRSSPWIELTLVDGVVVRIPQENLAALTTVLRTLRTENGDRPLGEARHA